MSVSAGTKLVEPQLRVAIEEWVEMVSEDPNPKDWKNALGFNLGQSLVEYLDERFPGWSAHVDLVLVAVIGMVTAKTSCDGSGDSLLCDENALGLARFFEKTDTTTLSFEALIQLAAALGRAGQINGGEFDAFVAVVPEHLRSDPTFYRKLLTTPSSFMNGKFLEFLQPGATHIDLNDSRNVKILTAILTAVNPKFGLPSPYYLDHEAFYDSLVQRAASCTGDAIVVKDLDLLSQLQEYEKMAREYAREPSAFTRCASLVKSATKVAKSAATKQ
jgi:hypothetical protein